LLIQALPSAQRGSWTVSTEQCARAAPAADVYQSIALSVDENVPIAERRWMWVFEVAMVRTVDVRDGAVPLLLALLGAGGLATSSPAPAFAFEGGLLGTT
jgi:hypothetical protein